MQILLRVVSYLGLALTVGPALLVFAGSLEPATCHRLMIVGMLLWFGAGVFWIKPEKTEN